MDYLSKEEVFDTDDEDNISVNDSEPEDELLKEDNNENKKDNSNKKENYDDSSWDYGEDEVDYN